MAITVGTDSYISIADAQAILDNYFDTDNWDSADTTTKEKSLKQATRNIDTLYLLYSKYDDTQALQFPRSVAMQFLNEKLGEIPESVEKATTMEALKILDERANADPVELLKAKGIKSQSIKDTSFTFDDLALRKKVSRQDSLVSDDARKLLRPYIQKSFTRT